MFRITNVVGLPSSNNNDPPFLAARLPYQEPARRHDLGHMNVKCSSCGALHWMNERNSHSLSSNPIFGLCCDSGKVILPVLRDPPPCLKDLFDSDSHQGKDFRQNIWKYNRAFAFMSLQVTEDYSVNERHKGQSVFRIQGELHHRGGPLFPAVDRPPTYAQLYFYDSQAALEYRCCQNSGLNPDTLRTLQHMLLNNHQYVPVYRHAFEILQNYNPDNDVSICLCVAPGHDRHRYNLLTADEVAVILPGVDGDNMRLRERDVILHSRAGELQIISDLHPAYVPLYYVLLFPYGENSWHPDLKLRSSNNRTT